MLDLKREGPASLNDRAYGLASREGVGLQFALGHYFGHFVGAGQAFDVLGDFQAALPDTLVTRLVPLVYLGLGERDCIALVCGRGAVSGSRWTPGVSRSVAR